MGVFSKVLNYFTGDAGGVILEKAVDLLPDNMSEVEKQEFKIKFMETIHKQNVEIIELAQNDTESFNERIRGLEGTASDLKGFGILGRFILFIRGLQRPIWGFGVIYCDFMIFSGSWKIETEKLESAFWMINIIVLTFLFGERCIKNLSPIIEKLFKKS